MRTLKLTLAYDGTNYVGWQRQVNGVSVQQKIEEAFAPMVGEPPTVAGASRTDAGVHALGQVASVSVALEYDPPAIQRALNVRLPPDIRVLHAEEARPGFHARSHAVGKTYRYRLTTGRVASPFDRWFVWHSPGPRDLDAMRRAASSLVGRRDFVSFQARGSTITATTRTVHRIEIEQRDDQFLFEIDGDGFLRHMVRAIVGTLAEIGAGSRAEDSVPAMLAARDRQAAGPTAPASGLTLVSVRYSGPRTED